MCQQKKICIVQYPRKITGTKSLKRREKAKYHFCINTCHSTTHRKGMVIQRRDGVGKFITWSIKIKFTSGHRNFRRPGFGPIFSKNIPIERFNQQIKGAIRYEFLPKCRNPLDREKLRHKLNRELAEITIIIKCHMFFN